MHFKETFGSNEVHKLLNILGNQEDYVHDAIVAAEELLSECDFTRAEIDAYQNEIQALKVERKRIADAPLHSDFKWLFVLFPVIWMVGAGYLAPYLPVDGSEQKRSDI